MDLVRANGKRLLVSLALAVAAAFAALALTATAPASAAACPSFRVLHDDRIGAASFPAGSYEVTTDPGLGCQDASQLFARFLEDYDGNLPKPWRVVAEGSGKASFTRAGLSGFSVARTGGGEGGGSNVLGKLCSGTFAVNAGAEVGPLVFPKGRYLIYLPPQSGITCRRASVLFTRFLAARGGTLPFPWRVLEQTATFYKPEHAQRSSFRIEPLNGA